MASTTTGSAQRGRRQPTSKQGRSSASQSKKTSSPARTSARAESTSQQSSGASIPVPYVTAQLHTTHIPLPEIPGRNEVASTVTAVRGALPSRDQLLFYSGLTAAAALSVIEWPVAAAIGIGAAVVQRNAHQGDESA
ncbi:hypothetical protein [Saccharopolyspora endophytica]|uniref:hypothetical protein n=1 Tax=Saccharopolyspora endophytica TaxID=543886 RepID=UPI001FE8ECF5|nr:hypothetical protein [Saccharopolyspora endophytica]